MVCVPGGVILFTLISDVAAFCYCLNLGRWRRNLCYIQCELHFYTEITIEQIGSVKLTKPAENLILSIV